MARAKKCAPRVAPLSLAPPAGTSSELLPITPINQVIPSTPIEPPGAPKSAVRPRDSAVPKSPNPESKTGSTTKENVMQVATEVQTSNPIIKYGIRAGQWFRLESNPPPITPVDQILPNTPREPPGAPKSTEIRQVAAKSGRVVSATSGEAPAAAGSEPTLIVPRAADIPAAVESNVFAGRYLALPPRRFTSAKAPSSVPSKRSREKDQFALGLVRDNPKAMARHKRKLRRVTMDETSAKEALNQVLSDAESRFALAIPFSGSQSESHRPSVTLASSPAAAVGNMSQVGNSSETVPIDNSRDINTAIPNQSAQQPTIDTLKDSSAEANRIKEILIIDQVRNWFEKASIKPADGQLENEQRRQGKRFHDGFGQTWFIPTCTGEQQATRKIVTEARKTLNNETTQEVFGLIEQEAQETCQHEWDGTKGDPKAYPRSWVEIKKNGLEVEHLICMVARNRIYRGLARLPNYITIKVMILSIDGKWMPAATVYVPPGVNFNILLARLDEWDPEDPTAYNTLFEPLRQELRWIARVGVDDIQEKAQSLLMEIDCPINQDVQGIERRAWSFKGEDLSQSEWTALDSDETMKKLRDEAREGKTAVLVRKVRLYRLWSQAKVLRRDSRNARGEPILTEDQWEKVDQLLAGQSDKAREQGKRLATFLDLIHSA